MKIAIFDTTHFEVTHSLICLFDNGQNDITIFVYAETYQQLVFLLADKIDNYTWHVKPDEQPKRAFVQQVYKKIQVGDFDMLYLATVSDNFIIHAWHIRRLKQLRTILTLHNSNSFFTYKGPFSIRKMIRYAGKRLLIKSVREFTVLSTTLIPSLQKRTGTGKKIHCIPGGFFHPAFPVQLQPAVNNTIHLVIPGSIDEKRRDYHQLFTLLAILQKENIPVTCTILGAAVGEYGQSVLKKCSSWNQQNNIAITFYEDSVIDQPVFDAVMNAATFVFAPVVVETIIDDDVQEVYGETISSGTLSDVTRHAKPFIVPASLNIEEKLKASAYCYKDLEEIGAFIKDIFLHPELYTTLLHAARSSSQNYTLEKIRKDNTDVFG